MNLQELLTKNNLDFISADSIEESVKEMLAILQQKEHVAKTPDVLESIIKNEIELPCAAGRGVAYPHGISTGIRSFKTVIGISKSGINCESPDGLPCHIIVLTISPDTDVDDHIKFISLFQKMISDSTIRAEIIDSDSIESILDIVYAWNAQLLDPEDDDI